MTTKVRKYNIRVLRISSELFDSMNNIVNFQFKLFNIDWINKHALNQVLINYI